MAGQLTSRATRARRPQNVRGANLGLVLDHVRFGPMSRSDLVEATGLTRSSIAALVAELSALDLVVERRSESDGSPGRPSPIVANDPSRFAVLATEIAVDSLSAALVGIDGTVFRSARNLQPRHFGSIAATIGEIVELTSSVVSRGGGVALLGAGVAVAGLVRRGDHRVAVAPNLGWFDVDLANALGIALEQQLGVRLRVEVGNEADLGATAESRFGAGRGVDHMLFVTGEVGLGGSMIVGGDRILGHSGFAGEIGHIQVNPDGTSCRCGAVGCLETEVGERAVLARAGIDPDGAGNAVNQLLAAADDGNRAALAAIAESGRWLGAGLGSLFNVFDPELVVIGGLYGRLLPFARASLETELARRRFRGVERAIPVVPAELGLDANLIGAAELVVERLVNDPRGVVSAARSVADVASS